MGRWTQLDEDDARLPEGFKCIGYDSDVGRYYFRSADGALWEGPQGSRYGEMTKLTNGSIELNGEQSIDVEAAGPRQKSHALLNVGDYRPTPSPYRTLFPFFLLICATLLLAWRLFSSFTPPPPPPPLCPTNAELYLVRAGDTCWELARSRGSAVDTLKSLNEGIACDRLRPGQNMCVPVGAAASTLGRRRM